MYNLLITVNHFERLSKYAHNMHKIAGEQVSIADLMREAISVYLDNLDREYENGKK
jgi:hypothetical protein